MLSTTIVRYLFPAVVLGLCAGCVTPVDGLDSADDDQTVIAGIAPPETATESTGGTGEPAAVIRDGGVAGRNEAGEKVYCRKSARSGSRIPQKICMTEEQRRKQQEYSQEVLRNSDRIGLISRTAR